MRRKIQVKERQPQFCVVTGITFTQVDAWFGNTMRDLKMDLIYPKDAGKKYPCVVWICGGAWIQMDRSAHLAYLSNLAQQGFVVASVEYRTSNEAKYPAPLQDVKAGIRYLRAHAERFCIDPDRIGVMGESAGGYLTCMAALADDPIYDVGENLEYSSAVQAACPWYPPTDFRGFLYSDPEQCAAAPESLLLGKNVMRHPEEALACCPVSFVTKDAPPFLIIHGDNDHTVPFGQGEELHDELEKAGCEIIRCTIPTLEAAQAIREIRKQIHIPLVADIHFDYKMAIAAIENGADKIRINPGNIGGREKLSAVVSAAKEHNIPIRVGVNSGSLEKELVEKYHGVTAEGIVESALDKVHMIEEEGYENMVISIKSSDVLMCVRAHEILSQKTDYPLHVGITEAGTIISGNIKSSIGLGLILHQGIGDTIRVSLTGDPVEEIKSAKIILRTLGLRKGGIEVVSCPTCGRTKIDLIGLANQVETMVAEFPLNIKVAVMGCAVNGPGEAKEADLGIAGGIHEGLLIKKGEIIRKVPEDQLLSVLREELEHWES